MPLLALPEPRHSFSFSYWLKLAIVVQGLPGGVREKADPRLSPAAGRISHSHKERRTLKGPLLLASRTGAGAYCWRSERGYEILLSKYADRLIGEELFLEPEGLGRFLRAEVSGRAGEKHHLDPCSLAVTLAR